MTFCAFILVLCITLDAWCENVWKSREITIRIIKAGIDDTDINDLIALKKYVDEKILQYWRNAANDAVNNQEKESAK